MNSYRKLSAEFYDIDKPVPPPEVLDFYRSYARQSNGVILEPMCGSGRFLLPLLAEGHLIEGVDASADMARACRERGVQLGLQPTVHEQFVQLLDLPTRYGLVIIPDRSICLLTEPSDTRAALARLQKHMEPGAVLVLEVERLVAFVPGPWDGRWVDRPDGARIAISWLNRYDAANQTVQSIHRYELFRNGRLLETEWEELGVRMYEPAEFLSLLEVSGFVDIRRLDNGGKTGVGDSAMVFECRRP